MVSDEKSKAASAKTNNSSGKYNNNKANSSQTSLNQFTDNSNFSVSNSSANTIWTTSPSSSISNTYGSALTSLGSGLYVTGLSTNDPADDFLRLFVLSHDEEEITTSLSKIKELCITYEDDRGTWENIILAVLKIKHFSEEFIINYLDEVTEKDQLKEAILVHHAGDVYSRKYATLALKILIDK